MINAPLVETFGYGSRPGEPTPNSGHEIMSQLQRGVTEVPLVPFGGWSQREATLLEYRRVFQVQKARARENYRPLFRKLFLEDQHARIAEPVLSPNGFFHRLLNFWSNHFAVAKAKSIDVRSLLPFYETSAIRPHVTGRFSDMVWAVETHAAMILYLDQQTSIGPNSRAGTRSGRGLNENLAREILELHTLGVSSNYTQSDVRALAEILTGLRWRAKTNEVQFSARTSQTGTVHFLGKSVELTPGNVEPRIRNTLEGISLHPATARHISEKLVRHFISDSPPAPLVDAMTARFMETGGHLPTVYGEMIGYAEQYRPTPQKFKPPLDLVVSGLRALGAEREDLVPKLRRAKRSKATTTDQSAMSSGIGGGQRVVVNQLTLGALKRLNHETWAAPGPDGWPDNNESWITPQGLAERLLWSRRVAKHFKQEVSPLEFLELTLGQRATDRTRFVVSAAASRQEGISLVLMSPEFNRR